MADGQVLIDSKINTAGVERGTKEIKEEFQDLAKVTEKVAKQMKKELDNTGDAADDAAGSFRTLFKANLSADIVLNAIKQLGQAAVDLAKETVAAAAEINASNAQFEQTFKGIEKTARDSLNKISKEVGITATRMQDSYTKIFAFTKSVGADQEQALDIASRALTAAADSAAYYDVSVEQATETLQSFLKGNYENDAALGIAATETTRNAKANEMYAKSFQELSEAQKVDVLLAMVEAGNAASGAMGQAAREADSWTNVTGELQEAWRLLLGVLGDPLLQGLIPIIQGITSSIHALIQTTASADLSSGMEDFRNTIRDLESDFITISEKIEKNAALAELYRTRLEELEKEGFEPNSAAAIEYSHAVESLNEIYPELNLQISESTGLIDDNSRARLANIETMKQEAIYAAYAEQYRAAMEARADATMAVYDATNKLADAEANQQIIENQLQESTGRNIDELIRLYTAQTIASGGFEQMGFSIAQLTPEQEKLIQQYMALNTEIPRLEQGIADSNATIEEQDKRINEISSSMELWAERTGQSVTQASEASQEAVSQTGEAIAEQNQDTLSQIEANTANTVDAIAQDSANAASAFETDFSTPTQENAEATGEVISESLSNAADTMETEWGDEAQWFKSNVETPISTSVGNIGSAMLGTLGTMEKETEDAWNRMVKDVEDAIQRMQAAINGLTGKSIDVTVNKTGSGAGLVSASGYDGRAYSPDEAAYTPAVVSAIPAGIPMLATGAVIPPNAPFFAMLGDQTNGRNLEAPEKLIRQIIQEEIGEIVVRNEISFTGELAALARILYPEIQSEARRIGPSLAEEVMM